MKTKEELVCWPEGPVAELPDEPLPVWHLTLSVILLQDPAHQRQRNHKLAALDPAVFLDKREYFLNDYSVGYLFSILAALPHDPCIRVKFQCNAAKKASGLDGSFYVEQNM